MKKLMAYGLSFLMALTCLTGCGGGEQADLRVAVGKDTENLDPAIVDDSVTANILAQVYFYTKTEIFNCDEIFFIWKNSLNQH